MAIKWVDSLSVANNSVDNDHKHLINIINRIELALNTEADDQLLKKGLKDLEEYTSLHFDREEALMKSANYPNYYRHFKEHRELMNTLNVIKMDILKKLNSGEKISDPDSLVTLLRHWLLDHVMQEDLLLKPYFKKLISLRQK